MNSPARETPTPGSALMVAKCPQCQTEVRLLQPATVTTPISCYQCGTAFYIQAVATAPLSADPPRPPLRLVSPPPPPPPRPADRAVANRPDAPRATALTSAAPPVPTYAAPGMPRPVELPEHLQRNFRTRWMESVLGATLVLLVVVAVTAGGFVLIRTVWPTQPPAAREADAEPAVDGPADAALAAPNPADVALLKAAAKPLDRPVELAGEWDSRADDGSHSAFDFHPDGTVVITPANYPRTPRGRGQWYVAEHRGDDLSIDVGTEFGAAGNYRFVLRFNGPESFTLTRTIRNGVSTPSQLRYVRVGPPRFGATDADKSTAPPP